MSRKSNGEGTIYKSGDRFVGQISVGRDLNGKLIRKSVYGKTKKEVLEKVTEVQSQVHKGVFYEPSEATVEQWLNQWFEIYKKLTLREQTKNLYLVLMKSIINPKIGAIKLKSVAPMHIQMLINKLVEEKYSTSTIQKIKNILNPALNIAVNNKLIPFNPWNGVQFPKNDEREIRALNRIEIPKLEKASAKSNLHECFITALDTGLRCGELLALTWDDVDFKNNLLTVNKTIIKAKDKSGKETIISQELTKTRSSNRMVPLTERCARLLKALKLRTGQNLVFCTKAGAYLNPNNLRRTLRAVCKNAEINNIGMHVLRHTYATRLFEAGVRDKTVSELLGHSKIQITLDTYVTVSDDNKKDAVDILNKLIQSL